MVANTHEGHSAEEDQWRTLWGEPGSEARSLMLEKCSELRNGASALPRHTYR